MIETEFKLKPQEKITFRESDLIIKVDNESHTQEKEVKITIK